MTDCSEELFTGLDFVRVRAGIQLGELESKRKLWIPCPFCAAGGSLSILGALYIDKSDRLAIITEVRAGDLDASAEVADLSRIVPCPILNHGHDHADDTVFASWFDKPAYLTCPDVTCGRRQGPYTARGLRRRLRQGLEITVI